MHCYALSAILRLSILQRRERWEQGLIYGDREIDMRTHGGIHQSNTGIKVTIYGDNIKMGILIMPGI